MVAQHLEEEGLEFFVASIDFVEMIVAIERTPQREER